MARGTKQFEKVHGTQKLADVSTGLAFLGGRTRQNPWFLVPESCSLCKCHKVKIEI